MGLRRGDLEGRGCVGAQGNENVSPAPRLISNGAREGLDLSRSRFLKNIRHLRFENPFRFENTVPHTISKDFTFAAAHFIPDHPGKCRNMHGHNYRVRVYVRAESLDHLGMVLDFSYLKQLMKETIGIYDHKVLNEIPPFDRINSTAELLCEHIFNEIQGRLAESEDADRVRLHRVDVWESDSSCASYEA